MWQFSMVRTSHPSTLCVPCKSAGFGWRLWFGHRFRFLHRLRRTCWTESSAKQKLKSAQTQTFKLPWDCQEHTELAAHRDGFLELEGLSLEEAITCCTNSRSKSAASSCIHYKLHSIVVWSVQLHSLKIGFPGRKLHICKPAWRQESIPDRKTWSRTMYIFA